jgi:hypothetical protein
MSLVERYLTALFLIFRKRAGVLIRGSENKINDEATPLNKALHTHDPALFLIEIIFIGARPIAPRDRNVQ